MLHHLAKNWWLLAIRGIAGVLFGIVALLWPAITLGFLVTLYGAYAFTHGVFTLITALRPQPARTTRAIAGGERRTETGRGWLFFEGLLGIGVGLVTFFLPQMTAVVLILVIGAWSFATGILEIIEAVKLRKEIRGEWMLGLAGAASVALGLTLALAPAIGTLALVWMLGVYAIVFGVLFFIFALRLRAFGRASSTAAGGFPGVPHPGAT